MEKLIKGKVVKFDEEYLDIIDNSIWTYSNGGVGYYYLCFSGKGKSFHRFIMQYELSEFSIINNINIKSIKIDHINRDTLDNRKVNLRCVTHSDNLMNRPKQKNNTSGVKGLYIRKQYNTYYYIASLQYKGKTYCKMFKTKEQAIQFRKDKIKELNIFEPSV